MSRRSLRLEDNLLDRTQPHSSASFSTGGASWRSSRSLRSCGSKQLSTSCSESLLPQTPVKSAGPSFLNSSLHSVASDASLISSLLEESTMQESTLVDNLWGLDPDSDMKESAALAEDNGTSVRPPLSRLYCPNCEAPSSSCFSSVQTELRESDTSLVYRGGRRKRKENVLQVVGGVTARCFDLLLYAWQVCVGWKITQEDRRAARPAPLRVMNLKEVPTGSKDAQPTGSLCDDCQEVQHYSSSSSVLSFLRRSAQFTARALSLLAHTAAAVLWPLMRDMLKFTWSGGRSAGGVFAHVLGPPCRRWCRSCRSLTRLTFGLLLFLLLLLLSLKWFGPPALQSVLLSDWMTAPTEVGGLESSERQSGEDSFRPQEEAPLLEAAQANEGEKEAAVEYCPRPSLHAPQEVAASAEWARLFRVEQRLAKLWERVEAGGRRADLRHEEVLLLHTTLQQQWDGKGAWLKQLLDQQLSEIRRQLDEDRQQREQMQQMEVIHQHAHTSRLDQLELQLKTLITNTQQLQLKLEFASPKSSFTDTLQAAFSIGVDRQSHDALMAEVTRLDAALQDIRRELESLSGCRDGCRQLATARQEISGQVALHFQEELQLLVSGAAEGGAMSSKSLLQWLSQYCVSKSDLQEALLSVQHSILQNVSLRLEQQHSNNLVGDSIQDSMGGSVTAEDVDRMVTNALRLFSQDRTGMADYALESGGGSIMSTRCSETYKTKAALLSLFGVPLWYFSQSPRAVIQPDVHPGNCWAFRGSSGFLVIRLSMRIRPTAFSLEHIPRALAPSQQLLSAPRDFSVYGLDHGTEEEETLLGSYTYDQDGEALQTFAVTEDTDKTFQIVEVQVLSNWGHPDFTCLYRFRVHGTPATI